MTGRWLAGTLLGLVLIELGAPPVLVIGAALVGAAISIAAVVWALKGFWLPEAITKALKKCGLI